ncbi:MAG: hypothetical protein Q8L55_07905 [Phycisphaerales bacterium]|nr:hypothetical protein [Phycisphaerales bacterium]
MTPPAPDVRLRPVTPADLPALFELQQDLEGNRMSLSRPQSREASDAAWEKTLGSPSRRAVSRR